jgi:hypothetical protein
MATLQFSEVAFHLIHLGLCWVVSFPCDRYFIQTIFEWCIDGDRGAYGMAFFVWVMTETLFFAHGPIRCSIPRYGVCH